MSLLPGRKARIDREAADWIARLGNRPSAELIAKFKRWRDKDPRHAEAHERLSAIWSGSAQTRRKVPANLGIARSGQSFRYAVAAGLAALVIGLFLLGPGSPLAPGQAAILATSLSETRQIGLADGSSIILGPGSRLEAEFGSDERRLSFRQGSARIRAARDDRPFIIEAGGQQIVAPIEASIQLTSGAAQIVVIPIEGQFEVRDSNLLRRMLDETRSISPGQKLLIDEAGARIEASSPKAEVARPEMIELDDMPLADAAALVGRTSNVKLRLAGDRVRRLRVSGAYRAGDTAGFARSLAAAFGLSAERQADGSILLTSP